MLARSLGIFERKRNIPVQSGVISLAVNNDLIVSHTQMHSVNCEIIHKCQLLRKGMLWEKGHGSERKMGMHLNATPSTEGRLDGPHGLLGSVFLICKWGILVIASSSACGSESQRRNRYSL